MKIIFSSIFITLLLIAGCDNTDTKMSDREKVADELDPTRNKQTPDDPELDSRLGYVNYKKDQFKQHPENDHIVTLDRNELADMIARVILRNEGFHEIATLVTDEEVLIAYEKDDTLTDAEAAEIAKKSAMSILPRFFEIYVSNDASLKRDIQSLHNSTTKNKNYDNTLDRIISEMQKSPQGISNERE